MTPPVPVDWTALRAQARDAMSRAYAPYSGYLVGAAALVDDGRTITGCNVENASYGLALCAECGLISALFAGRPDNGGPAPRLTAFTCVDGAGDLLVPAAAAANSCGNTAARSCWSTRRRAFGRCRSCFRTRSGRGI